VVLVLVMLAVVALAVVAFAAVVLVQAASGHDLEAELAAGAEREPSVAEVDEVDLREPLAA
jgi:preprotein translocase subunit SecG